MKFMSFALAFSLLSKRGKFLQIFYLKILSISFMIGLGV